MSQNAILIGLILLPCAGALLLGALRGIRGSGKNFLVCAVTAAEFLMVLWLACSGDGTGECPLTIKGLFGLGAGLKSDGFRVLYGGIAAFMWLMTALFSGPYFEGHENQGRYYIFTLLTLASVEGLFFSADFYTAFVFFEVMSLTSYVWVAQEETEEALRAAATYLAIAVTCGLVLLMGLFLLYGAAGTLEFEALGALVRGAGPVSGALGAGEAAAAGGAFGSPTLLYVAGACLLVGFGAKAGCYPLHVWLPKAHAVAPAPASALLSGILTKAGVFGILLVTVYLFPGDGLWGSWLLILGLVTMVLGAVLALFSNQLKRTLACSSMSQIGFILVGAALIALLGGDNELAVRGTVLHMVNHSLIKLLLFMAAGVVFMNLGELGFDEIRGFGRNKPFLLFVFLMGALGIAGVPGWNGYVSKTLLHESILKMQAADAVLGAGMWRFVEAAFLFAGGLTAAYMMKVFVVLFVEKHPERQMAYDGMAGSYLDGRSRVVLGLSAVILPAMGLFPKRIMDQMALYGQGFLGGRQALGEVPYFSLENLKGAAISLAVGILVYALVARPWMTEWEKDGGRRYPDRWPWWLDLENSIYRPLMLIALPAVCGFVGRVMDHAADGLILLARKTTHRQTRERYKRLDGDRLGYLAGLACDDAALLFDRLTFRKRERRSAIPRMVEIEEMFLKTAGIFGTSLSFSLMLVCLGLCLTLLYLIL